MPHVSIITALHNKGPYIAETIASVRGQTLADWEMIVVENGSNDDGPEQVDAIARQDPRIRLIRAPESARGPGTARNLGLEHATGEWVLFLDADDLLRARHLEALLESAAKQSGADIAVSRWQRFQDTPDRSMAVDVPASEGRSHSALLDSAIAFAPWAVHAALIRRLLLGPGFWWPERLDSYLGEDTAFWFKLLNRTTRLASCEEAGALYRWQTPDCRTQNGRADKWFAGLHHAVTENLEYLRGLGLQPTVGQCDSLMRLYEGTYQLAVRTGDQAIARTSLELSGHWLRMAMGNGSKSHGLWARRLLGLRLFNCLRTCRHFQD
jgi:glycosyltransferase involved in cell wall biosynthesis